MCLTVFSLFLADIQLEIFQMIFNWRYLAESFKCVSLSHCFVASVFLVSLSLYFCLTVSPSLFFADIQLETTGEPESFKCDCFLLKSLFSSCFFLALSFADIQLRYLTQSSLLSVLWFLSFSFFWLETGDNGARKSLNFLENVQIKFIKQRHLFQLVPDNKHSVKSSSFFVVLCNWEQQPQWSYSKEWLWTIPDICHGYHGWYPWKPNLSCGQILHMRNVKKACNVEK